MQNADSQANPVARAEMPDRGELSRQVFGILGIPIDAMGLLPSLRALEAAVENRETFLISMPNVNFLVRHHGSHRRSHQGLPGKR